MTPPPLRTPRTGRALSGLPRAAPSVWLPVLLLALPLASASGSGPGTDGPRRSLEVLRREAAGRAAAAAEALRGALDAVLVDAAAVPEGERPERRPQLVGRIVDLGPDVAPLLVPKLLPPAAPELPNPVPQGGDSAGGEDDGVPGPDDGGSEGGSNGGRFGGRRSSGGTDEAALMERVRGLVRADETQQFVRSVCQGALEQLAGPAVTEPLLDLLDHRDADTRDRALDVLAHTREPDRVAPGLYTLFADSEGEPRARALATLARLDGDRARELTARALGQAEPSVMASALGALAAARSRASAGAVLAFSQSDHAPRFVQPVLAYYRAMPDLLVDEHLAALVALTAHRDTPRLSTAAILDTLRELEVKPPRRTDRLFDDLGESASKEVREAALAYLASQGDKRARRDLLAPYDEAVERQPDYAAVYTQRGDVLSRVFDWNDALKDYKQAISLEGRGRRDGEPYLGAAVCYARMRRFKDAAAYLNRSPYSTAQLRELAQLPAFAEMLDSKYAEAFRLP